jgi:hypothetical protein
MSSIPEINGKAQVIMQPEAQDAVPITTNIISSNDIRLSYNMKLKIDHKGIIETESTFASTREYTEVTVTPTIADQYGLSDDWIGETIHVSVDKDPNTFPLASCSTDDTELIPANIAMAEDETEFLALIKDLPGNTGGPAMTSRNYLVMSSEQNRAAEVPGDWQDEVSSSTSI